MTARSHATLRRAPAPSSRITAPERDPHTGAYRGGVSRDDKSRSNSERAERRRWRWSRSIVAGTIAVAGVIAISTVVLATRGDEEVASPTTVNEAQPSPEPAPAVTRSAATTGPAASSTSSSISSSTSSSPVSEIAVRFDSTTDLELPPPFPPRQTVSQEIHVTCDPLCSIVLDAETYDLGNDLLIPIIGGRADVRTTVGAELCKVEVFVDVVADLTVVSSFDLSGIAAPRAMDGAITLSDAVVSEQSGDRRSSCYLPFTTIRFETDGVLVAAP